MTELFLGIDGGGTKTLATICNSDGRVLGTGAGGPSNVDDVGTEAASVNIDQAVRAAREQALSGNQGFVACFLGLAGVVSAQDRDLIRQMALTLALAPPDRIGVHHDGHVALAGGLSGRSGAVLIVGTGSSCYGVSGCESWRAGGWGSLISDEGSGYFLGREGLSAAVRALDGRGPPTLLAAALLEELKVHRPDDLLHRLYVTGLSRSGVAALAPLVLDAAGRGDAVANDLVEQGCGLLAECVGAVAGHLLLEQLELVIVGGLYTASPLVQSLLNRTVTTRLPGCRIVPPELPPVLGACLLALQLNGPVVAATLQRLSTNTL